MQDELARLLADRLGLTELQKVAGKLAEPFTRLDPEGFTRAARAAIETGRKIGQAGWTFPMEARPREVFDLARQPETEDIDSVFVRYYDEGGYQPLKDDVLTMETLAPWRELIRQSFIAFESGLTLVVVPAMMTVVEGSLARVAGAERDFPQPTRLARRLREQAFPDSITLAVQGSVEEFINLVFSSHSFDGAKPNHLNRHWILHGRDEATWNRADCLRLFQPVETIG